MTKFRISLLAALAAVCVYLKVSSQTLDDGEVRTEEPGKTTYEKTLDGDVHVTVVKVGREPAVATINVPGKDPVEFDAYEPLETAPEEAREYLASVWDRLGETPKKIVNIEIDTSEAPDAAEWARRAQTRVQYWYPRVVEMLDGQEGLERIPDDFKIRLVFKPIDGVAYAAGREITVSSNYIKRKSARLRARDSRNDARRSGVRTRPRNVGDGRDDRLDSLFRDRAALEKPLGRRP